MLVHEHACGGAARGELILVHGLEGSNAAGYIRSMAQAALEGGYNVHRMNLRGCGGDYDNLYDGGLTHDLRAISETLRRDRGGPLFVVGYSLGGNIVLKLAGEWGESARECFAGICAVSTPLDLEACVRKIDAPRNLLYSWWFLRSLKARYRRRCWLHPNRYQSNGVEEARSIYDFDDRITAPAFGFGGASEYYRTQSACRFLDRIHVPTLLLHAKDDPMIPLSAYDHPALRENPAIELRLLEHGGHLGFLARRRPRFWLDKAIVEWLDAVRRDAAGPPLSEERGANSARSAPLSE